MSILVISIVFHSISNANGLHFFFHSINSLSIHQIVLWSTRSRYKMVINDKRFSFYCMKSALSGTSLKHSHNCWQIHIIHILEKKDEKSHRSRQFRVTHISKVLLSYRFGETHMCFNDCMVAKEKRKYFRMDFRPQQLKW